MTDTQEKFKSFDSLLFANGEPSGQAILKHSCVDFIVDEELGFPLSGNGEHLCIRIQKTDITTAQLVRHLRELFKVDSSAIGYGGLKDRRAITSQWFSVQLPAGEDSDEKLLASIENESLKVLENSRNSRKIKIGSHRANHFVIRLRDCTEDGQALQDLSTKVWETRLENISTQGVPNYFGPQRFGWDYSNLQQVWELMESALPGPSGAQQESGGAKQENASAQQRGRRRGRQGRGRNNRNGMLFSAARSYLFNLQLSHRLELSNWAQYLQGDVLNLDGSNRCFLLDEGLMWDEEMQQRLDSFDIHITGLLPGTIESKERYVSSGKSADIEDAVCKEYPILLEGLKFFGLKASRRSFRFRPADLKWDWQDGDLNGTRDLILEFTLPRGAYASSLLRELCHTKNSELAAVSRS